MVMFVVLDSLVNKLLIKTHLSFHFCHEFLIYAEFFRMVAKVLIFRLMHLVKWMSSNSVDIYPLLRIRNKKLLYHIFCVC